MWQNLQLKHKWDVVEALGVKVSQLVNQLKENTVLRLLLLCMTELHGMETVLKPAWNGDRAWLKACMEWRPCCEKCRRPSWGGSLGLRLVKAGVRPWVWGQCKLSRGLCTNLSYVWMSTTDSPNSRCGLKVHVKKTWYSVQRLYRMWKCMSATFIQCCLLHGWQLFCLVWCSC